MVESSRLSPLCTTIVHYFKSLIFNWLGVRQELAGPCCDTVVIPGPRKSYRGKMFMKLASFCLNCPSQEDFEIGTLKNLPCDLNLILHWFVLSNAQYFRIRPTTTP